MTFDNLYRAAGYKELYAAKVYCDVDKECCVIIGDTPVMKTKEGLQQEIDKLIAKEPGSYAVAYKFKVIKEEL